MQMFDLVLFLPFADRAGATHSVVQRGRGSRGRGKRPAVTPAARKKPNKKAKNETKKTPQSVKKQPAMALSASSSSSSDGESEFDRIMRDVDF